MGIVFLHKSITMRLGCPKLLRFTHRLGYIFFQVSLLWASCYLCATNVNGQTANQAVFQQFLQNLKSPPPAQEFIFNFRDISFTGMPSNTLDIESYFCRWQSNAFLVKDCTNVANATTGEIGEGENASGYFEDSYWYKSKSETKISDRDDPIKKPNGLHTTILSMEQNQLSTVFNMGIPNVSIGGLQWRDNHFSAVTWRGNPIEGDVVADSHGDPELNIKLTFDQTNTTLMTVRYEFGKNTEVPGFIPNDIKRWIHSDDGAMKLSAEIQICSAKFYPGLLGRSSFSKELYNNAGAPYLTTIIDGKEIRHQIIEERRIRTSHVLIVIFVALTALGAALILYSIKKPNFHRQQLQ